MNKPTAEIGSVKKATETGPIYYDEDFFQHMPEEEIAFVDSSVQRRLDRDEFLYMEGEAATSLFYVRTGIVQTSLLNASGKEIILQIHKSGALLGLSAAMHGNRRIANARGYTSCELYEINNDIFRSLRLKYPRLADRSITMLVRRVRFFTDRYLSATYDSAASRLSVCLAYLYYEQLANMRTNRQTESIPIHIDQELMASMVGVSRQTVNKLLHRLAKDKIIKIHRDTIIFLNANYLLKTVEI